jgi:hypothetical protein
VEGNMNRDDVRERIYKLIDLNKPLGSVSSA